MGQRGSVQELPDSKEPESPITNPRPSYTPRKLIGDALLRSTKILRQHLSACHLSSCSFCSHLPPRPPQPSASTSLSSLWLRGRMQKGWCCCSAAPGSPGSHSFAVFQTSCCRHRGEPCWQAFFDTCTIQCVSGQRSDLIIRKLCRQREGGKNPWVVCQNIPPVFQLPRRPPICPSADTIHIFLFSAFPLADLFRNTGGIQFFPWHVTVRQQQGDCKQKHLGCLLKAGIAAYLQVTGNPTDFSLTRMVFLSRCISEQFVIRNIPIHIHPCLY